MTTVFFLLAAFLTVTIGPAPDKSPYRQPQLAAGNGMVALAFASGGSVMIATSTDGGNSFSAPRKVSESPVLATGRHRGPRVLFTGPEIVVSAVVGKTLATGEHAHGLPSDGDLVVWRSSDKGKTWSKPSIVNDIPGAPREGLHSMVSDGHGQLAAAWLDLRNQGTRLYGAFSKDGGATWSKNLLIYEAPGGTICQCCAPSLASNGPGGFTVMFRNVLGDSRDMYTIQMKDSQVVSKPAKVGSGTWTINACPMDGGGLLYAGGQFSSAWRRGEDVFLSTPDKPETKIGEGVDIALAESAGRSFVAWQKAGKVEVWTAGKTETLAERGGGFPALVGLSGGGLLAAWEADGAISTRRVR
jgi:BNR repeat-like domain